MKVIGGAIAVVGAYTALIPFVGPTFGYTMPPGADVPAWEWSASHFQRHVVPGAAAILGGALLWPRSGSLARLGSWVALAAGAWMILSPFVVRAWLGGMSGGMGGGEPSLFMQIITPLGYHHVPGIITVSLAAFALGSMLTRRRRPAGGEQPLPAHGRMRTDRSPSPERETVRTG